MLARMPTARPDVLSRRGGGGAWGIGAVGAVAAALLRGCGRPGVRGVAGTAPARTALWTAPSEPAAAARGAPLAALPPDVTARVAQLKLPDVIDIALRNNTATSAAWADARAAAASYGAAKGQFYPTLSLAGTADALKTVPSNVPVSLTRQLYSATLNLSWLLLDFGGRAGAIGQAREALLAADWTHNATLHSVVLPVEPAYFQYLGTKTLLVAQQTSGKEAETNLEAAQHGHRAGLATIADVLQAKTALSQALLTLEATEGQFQTTRGALALSMGLPANVPYDIGVPSDTTVPLGISDSVESLIERAVRERPDLAAQRTQVRAAQARLSVARSAALPSLTVSGNAGETHLLNPPPNTPPSGNSYTGLLTL